MNDEMFNENLEKIIIRIDGDDKYSFEILNPLFQRNNEDNLTEHSQVFSLIIVNFLEYLQLVNIEKYKTKGLTDNDMYINLICTLFNDYMANMKEDVEKWDIIIPQFIKNDKFKININLIRNKDTRELIKSGDKIEYVFKIILGSFNKKRKKPVGVMTENTVELFNKMVERINKHIEIQLNINREYRFKQIDLLNFADYFDMKFDQDAAGEEYPDVGIQFEKEPTTQELKGKKGKTTKKKNI
jgi:hypothetical protein